MFSSILVDESSLNMLPSWMFSNLHILLHSSFFFFFNEIWIVSEKTLTSDRSPYLKILLVIATFYCFLSFISVDMDSIMIPYTLLILLLLRASENPSQRILNAMSSRRTVPLILLLLHVIGQKLRLFSTDLFPFYLPNYSIPIVCEIITLVC